MLRYFVKPKERTVLSHKEYHEVSSTNLLLSLAVPTAHVIPEILDIERFNIALSGALSSFPLPAGRLARPDTPDAAWKILLTNSAVPVSLIDSDAGEIFLTDLTVQPPALYAEPMDVAGILTTEGESDEPLFRLTITRFTKLNATLIGACHSRVLFDGSGYLMFFKQISQLYQGLGSIDPPPFYEPKAIKFPEPLKAPLPFFDRFDPLAPPPWEQPEKKAMDFVAFRFTAAQLTEIHSSVAKRVKRPPKVTRVDIVMGLLAQCLSEVEPESKPIDTVSYVVNHRGMGIYPVNAALNAIIWLSTGLQVPRGLEPQDGVLAYATEIHKLLEQLKDPRSIEEAVAGLAKIQSQVAWDKSGQDIGSAKEGCLIANIIRRMDLTSPHFGHPGKATFHNSHAPGFRFVKITTPNPKFVNGAWISREGDMEGTLYVPPKRRKAFETLLEGYAQGLGVTGSVEFLL